MNVLGRIEEITGDGRLIVQCSELPEIGQPVFDSQKKKIGTVKRVFGPVEAPYASVKAEAPISEKARGTEVYSNGGKGNGKAKGRDRRN